MTDIVKVVAYDAKWPQLFEEEAKLIKDALGENCIAIYHIGSTAVPGLSAKPIIDILLVVKNILQVDQDNFAMEQLGYNAKGEYGIPFRRYFQKGASHRTHNVHVFEQGNPEIERHLKFPHDINSYCLGKDAFIADIDTKAGFDGLRIVSALTDREWEAVRYFRQKYFFDRVPIDDPYTWTFNHKEHIHFVLYKGTKIIGYAHIQLWPENRAALRIIVIDEAYRNKGYGSELLKRCECWLSQQDVNQLLVQSSPATYQFYCKNSYIEMPFNDPDGHEADPQDIEVGKNLGEIKNVKNARK